MKSTLSITACAVLLAACASPAEIWPTTVSAELEPRSGSNVHGIVEFTEGWGGVRVIGEVWGFASGSKGFHIHEKGDCSDPKAMSAGGHYNPNKTKHGAPGSGHVGDLGNLVFNNSGSARIDMKIRGVSIVKGASDSIIGRALVVHASQDDMKTDPTGNAGGRVACGVIGNPNGLTY